MMTWTASTACFQPSVTSSKMAWTALWAARADDVLAPDPDSVQPVQRAAELVQRHQRSPAKVETAAHSPEGVEWKFRVSSGAVVLDAKVLE